MARRRRKQNLPTELGEAHIESLSHDGRGIARIDGKTVFIDNALPQERVQFKYTQLHKKYDEAKTEHVLEAVAERATANCQHYGICGGCSLMHLQPAAQLRHKQATLAEHFTHFGQLQPEYWLEPMTGPIWGYRRKARLGVKYVIKKEKVLVGFREKGSPYLAELSECEVLDPRVGHQLEALRELIAGLESYNRIAQIEVAMDTSHTALVFRNLDVLSEQDQQKLVAFGQQHGFWIYQQPGGPDTVSPLWAEATYLSYSPESGTELRFQPGDFTQVNAEINGKMIQKALALLDLKTTDRVLDLFCGLGNFTLPIARRVHEVIGVEGESSLVERARQNADLNKLANAQFETADLTVTQLKDYPWATTGFNKVLLDPPRSGAFEVLGQIAALGAERIVYVSCNPATLARDAGELVNRYGYHMEQAGIMDMFPHTTHVESIASFYRK